MLVSLESNNDFTAGKYGLLFQDFEIVSSW